MASYTDAIAQFNPYVQQLPVDLMMKVGMAKQAQYDQGVQKVQSYIDNIAGMDIAHDADKVYLQSKLGELGNRLKTVAAGDFSNQQLVSSVGGMTSQIAKDSVIQEALASTAYYKKGNAAMEEARKKGTIGASNAYAFNKQAQAWLSNPEAGAKFRGTYTPYTDVNKKVIDVISKIHSNANLKDIGEVVTSEGGINTRKILDALHKQGYERVDEGQIRTVLNSALDATDLNQLNMDGAYNLRTYTPEKLAEIATTDYQNSTKMYAAKLEQANKELLITNDPIKIQQLNQSIQQYKNALGDSYEDIKGGLTENYENLMKTLKEDPDAVRGRIHTKSYIDQIANGFAWAHVKDELAVNPIASRVDDNFWKGKIQDLNVLEYNERVRHNLATEKVATGQLALDTLKAQAELSGGGTPYFTGSGDAPTQNLESYKNYSEHISGMEIENDGILGALAKENSSAGVTLKPTDIQKAIENGSFKPKTAGQQQQYDNYIKNKNLIANQRELVEKYENEAAAEITGGLNKKQALDKELRSAGTLTIGGVAFTSKEMYNFLQKERTRAVPTPGGGASYVLEIDRESLTPREKLLFSKMGRRYGTGAIGGVGGTGNDVVDNFIGKVKKAIVGYGNISSQINLKVAEKLAPITGSFRTEQAAVTFGKESEKDAFISNVTNIAKANLNQKAAGPNHNPENMISLLTNKTAKDVDFQLRRSGSKYYIEATDKNDPSKIERMEVTQKFVNDNPNLGAKFMNADTDLSQTMLRNAGGTNIFKDYKHAYYQNLGSRNPNSMPTVTLPVRADLVNSGGNLNAVFYAQTKDGKAVPITVYNPISSRADFEMYLSGLTDEKIIKLFKSQGVNNIEQIIKR
jgi:hypothetical protein